MPSPFKFQEPINKITTLTPGGVLSIEPPLFKRLSCIFVTAMVTKAAGGAGVYSIPVPSDIIGETQFKVGSSAQQTRTAAELFGATGLNALDDALQGGMVVYAQGGADKNGGVPVLIGSAEDLAVQATLAANTATTATFVLPFAFSEPFRKDYNSTEALALPTGFADGKSIGKVTLDLTMAGANGVAPAGMTGQSITASAEYDDIVLPVGAEPQLVKKYRFPVGYAAAGKIECAQQIKNVGILQQISLLTDPADPILDVEVKLGSRVIKKVTWAENVTALIRGGMNPKAIIRNRFDLVFDLLDDPNSAPILSQQAELSVMANLKSAAAGTKVIQVLVNNYGKPD